MTDWIMRPGHEIAAAIRDGKVEAVTVARAHLDRIDRLNARLSAFTDITRERALAKAAAIDAARARGEKLPPLAGVPFAAKNLFDIAGLVTRAGSKINRDNPPATADAAAVAALDAAGAVLLGALNMGEYAYDFTGNNIHDGSSRNPHDTERMSGGSSGGSGTAAAAGLAAITLGSDTNGSIRVPASFCGLFGLKPTYGALSRAGAFPFVASLDHVGPLARSARDLALAYTAMRKPDPADPVWNPAAADDVLTGLERETAGLRIGIADGHFAENGEPDAFAAVSLIAEALGGGKRVSLPDSHRARAAAFVITMIEGGALHAERLRRRARDFDPAVRDRLIAGAMLPAEWLVKAQKFRRRYRAMVLEHFRDFDVILAPATPCVAPPIEARTIALGGVQVPARPNIGIFTQPLSFIGLPVVAVPTWTAVGLPVGVQIIAAPGRDDLVLRVARALERNGICRSKVAAL